MNIKYEMKTYWLSFCILLIMVPTESKKLRGMIAAMDIYDEREHNAPNIPPGILPSNDGSNSLKFNSPFENILIHSSITSNYDSPTSYETGVHHSFNSNNNNHNISG